MSLLLLALFSRLPLYVYAVVKAYLLRNDLVAISTFWLGLLALSGAVGAIAVSVGVPHIYLTIFGYMNAVSLFMLAKTAKVVKRV